MKNISGEDEEAINDALSGNQILICYHVVNHDEENLKIYHNIKNPFFFRKAKSCKMEDKVHISY